MINHKNRKKKLIISYKNLTEEIRELFKETYPEGYQEYMQKTIKPNGEPIFVVPLETEDTSYMVKFDVKIDTGLVEEDLDKDMYGDDDQPESDFAPLSEAIDKEEGNNHTVGKMRHGALEEILDGLPDNKKEFEIASADIAAEFGDQADDEPDSYLDNDESTDEDDDIEPDDDELLDIESLLEEADAGEGMLREENPPEEKHGRRKKNESAEIKAVRAVKEEVKEAKKERKMKEVSTTTKGAKTPVVSKSAKTTAKPAKSPVVSKPVKVTKTTKTTVTAKTVKASTTKPVKVAAAKPIKVTKATKPAVEKKTTKKK